MYERIEDANAALIRLYLDGEPIPLQMARELFGDAPSDALLTLGMLDIIKGEGDEELVMATIQLVPIGDLWLASDVRPRSNDESLTHQDFVFSPNNELTNQYLAAITRHPRGRFVELCAGTGVAGLRALLDGADHAVVSDLVPRCSLFERFNALLNELHDRCTVVESDGWLGLQGEFDVAVAHPPYLPALAHRFDFRDAGEDGEQVSRAIIQGAPAHIRRGGSLFIRSALSDRKSGKIAERVRQWLGPASAEFDLVQIDMLEYGPMEAYKSITKGGEGYIDCERWLRHFEALEVERFAVCLLELRRTASGRTPITLVRNARQEMTADVFDWLFRWGEFVAQAGDTPLARLGNERPRVAPGTRLAVHLQADADASWRNVGAIVESTWPTQGLVKAPPLIPTLMELCDGSRDVHALLTELDRAGLIEGAVTEAQLAEFLEVLAAAGAIELSACPLPPRQGKM